MFNLDKFNRRQRIAHHLDKKWQQQTQQLEMVSPKNCLFT